MTVLLIGIAAVVLLGLLATRYGVDTRHTDPRDLRPSSL
jgi:hypothetical protein